VSISAGALVTHPMRPLFPIKTMNKRVIDDYQQGNSYHALGYGHKGEFFCRNAERRSGISALSQ
jgi:hypothetical protein